VLWALLLLWVLRLAPRVGIWTVPAYLSQVGLLGLLGAGVGVALHAGIGRVPLPLAFALAWTAGEWVRGAALGPLDFPWMGIVVPLTAVPELVQGAAWVGERGLAFLVALTNGAIALTILRMRGGGMAAGRLFPAGLALTGVVVLHLVGAARLAVIRPEPVLRALAVQPAIPLAMGRGGDPLALAAALAALDDQLPDTLLTDVDLVVIPETALPVVLDGPDAGALRATVASWARRVGRPVAVGAYGAAPGRGRTNAVHLAGPDPDAAWPRADKTRLVPGVEWIPFSEGSLARGEAPALLEVGGRTLAVLICIESAGSEPARGLRRLGADLIVNVTNDAWLGETPRWTRTAAFRQHPAHLRLRAVETGMGALRVGNNGLTTVVGPGGRERVLLAPFRAGTAVARVESLAGAPLFVRTGDLAGLGSALLLLALGLLSWGRDRLIRPRA
jgi:apolipoprotein N-acyltransferase